MGWLSDLFGIDDAKDELRRSSAQAQGTLQGGYDDIAGMYQPYAQGGGQAFSRLQDIVMGGPQGQVAVDTYRSLPGYQAGLDTGINAIDRSAVGRATGNVNRDLYRFGSDYEDMRFGDYLGRLGGLAGTGYSATGATAGARGNLASGQAGIQQGTGQELANAELAGGNLLMGGINTLAGLAGYGLGGGFGGGGFGVPTSGGMNMAKYTGVNDPRKYGALY